MIRTHKRTRLQLSTLLTLLVVCVAHSTDAWAQANAGVSDERVTLPQAPGSIAGVGENASVEGNQGALTYSIAVELPPGFSGVTPSLSLSYSSTAGSSVVGMGWAMPSFSIERMTVKGLQRYSTDDRFVVDGSDELVKVSDAGADSVYRARFERGFVRYTWVAHGTGAAGSWKAEYPDGRVALFGADSAGNAVSSAQVVVPSTTNVFRWHLVSLTDQWGHAMNFSYSKDASGYPLLERIEYLYEGGKPRHSVRFVYEPRPDIISDARPGFELKLNQRLAEIRIFSGATSAEQIRRYVIAHESDAVSAFTSRVSSVTRLGRADVPYPVKFSFGYSKTLGGACDGNCDKPFVRDMGTVGGVDFTTGRATLIDINGDALPDVLYSDAQGRHQFFYAKLDAEGRTSFVATAVSSAKTVSSSPFVLGDPKVQVIDVNGDGFVDITQAKLPAVLCNNGSGDWVESTFCTGASAPSLPAAFTPEDDSGDSAQQDPKYVRFFDYDNDKRIDWLRTPAGGTSTEVLVNSPSGFNSVTVDTIGAVFDDSPLQLADMNGDGLQDPVQVVISGAAVQLQYKLNLGYGKWSDWRSATISGLDASQAASADIEDINGDGLADLIAVTGNEVRMSLNRNGDAFSPIMLIDSSSLGSGSIPARTSTTVVSYADMNGNGSSDIVFIQSNGSVQYLELFPVRPNLMSRIDNGIGAVQLITYGTSIAEQGRDTAAGASWANRVPNAMTLVTRVDAFVTLTGSDSGGLRETSLYRYHSGYYDGVEKQFRGYEQLEHEYAADQSRDAQEPGLFVLDYDVGKSNAAFAGLLKKRASFAGTTGSLAALHEDSSLYDTCPVAESGSANLTYVCDKATTSVVIERDPAHALTTRIEREYDGYGNVTHERNLGVVNLGTPAAPQPCQPCTASGVFGVACGNDCMGDEHFSDVEYVTPGTDTSNAWVLSREKHLARGAVATSLPVETFYYYDGPDFEGLPLGKLTRGAVTRTTHRKSPMGTDVIASARYKRDAQGNVVERIDANGSTSDAASRRIYSFDAAGLNITSLEVRLAGSNGVTALRRDMTYESAFELMAQSSNWYPLVAGNAASTPQQTSYRYDEHGRLSLVLEPGDTDATATREFKYQLGDPASRVLLLQRSSATSGQDAQSASCFDGRGRLYQTRTKVNASTWQVSGFTEFDSRGAVARVYQAYEATSGECEKSPPSGVKFVTSRYDPLGRLTSRVEADGSTIRLEYHPLERRHFDEDNNDPGSAAANAPTIETFDGLNRLVATTRVGVGSLASATTHIEYTATGEVGMVRDAAGNSHSQTYDSLGRLTAYSDANAGTSTIEYDDDGNVVRQVDARGKVLRASYDSLNRVTARWDENDEAATKVTYTYDKVDGCSECTNGGAQLVEVRWPVVASTAGVDRFGFDARGRGVYSERTLAGRSFVTRRKFDQLDRETTIVHPGDLSFSFTYAQDSRPTGITGFLDKVVYDARGPVSEYDYANGTVAKLTFDDKVQVATHSIKSKDGTPFVDLSYTRSKHGDVLTLTDAATTGVPRSTTFGYDAWHRTTSAVLSRASGASETLTYTFDATDSIRSVVSSLAAESPANLGTYQYDAKHPNAVSSAGGLTYSYDDSGAMVSRGSTTFKRDHLSRLVSAARDGEEVGSFVYGGGVDRVIKREGDSTTLYLGYGAELQDGIVSAWPMLGGLRVARVQTDALASVVLSDLAPSSGDKRITIADAWVAQAAALGVKSLPSGTQASPVKALLMASARRLLMRDVTWLHADDMESVIASTDADGKVIAQQSFYPTGLVRASTGYVDSHGFTGEQKDESTGMIHFAFRDLDPVSGRWSGVDPAFTELSGGSLQYVDATSAYAYVHNDFANKVDSFGLWPSFLKSKATAAKSALKKPVGKKGDTRIRTVQLIAALASVAMSITSAVMAYNADATVDSSGHVQLDTSGKIAGALSISATVTSGLGSVAGASYDLHGARTRKEDASAPVSAPPAAHPPAAPPPPPVHAPPPPPAQPASPKPPVPAKPLPPLPLRAPPPPPPPPLVPPSSHGGTNP